MSLTRLLYLALSFGVGGYFYKPISDSQLIKTFVDNIHHEYIAGRLNVATLGSGTGTAEEINDQFHQSIFSNQDNTSKTVNTQSAVAQDSAELEEPIVKDTAIKDTAIKDTAIKDTAIPKDLKEFVTDFVQSLLGIEANKVEVVHHNDQKEKKFVKIDETAQKILEKYIEESENIAEEDEENKKDSDEAEIKIIPCQCVDVTREASLVDNLCIPTIKRVVLFDDYVSHLDIEAPSVCVTYQHITPENFHESQHAHCEGVRFLKHNPCGNENDTQKAEEFELVLPKSDEDNGKKICAFCNRSRFWTVFHNYISFLLVTYNEVEVCSGALYLDEQCDESDKIPTHFFKVIVCKNSDQTFRFECYKIEDKPMHGDIPELKTFLVPRAVLEAESGFKIFESIPDKKIREQETHPSFE